jgi:hypothetical protein
VEPLGTGSGREAELRREAKDLLLKATTSGRLATALGNIIAAPSVEDIELATLAKDTLEGAHRDGILSGSVEAMDSKMLREEAWTTMKAAADSGSLSTHAAQVATGTDSLRTEARDLLWGASTDGRLATALDDIRGQHDGDLRSSARDLLWDASLDGRLASALQVVRGEPAAMPAEAVRAQARDLLLNASTDGRLAAALQGLNQPGEQENLRAQARSLLYSASVDGRLSAALQQVKATAADSDIEELRDEARNVLFTAAADGRLSEAFGSLLGDDGLRADARSTLIQASMDGRLEAALAAMGPQPTQG